MKIIHTERPETDSEYATDEVAIHTDDLHVYIEDYGDLFYSTGKRETVTASVDLVAADSSIFVKLPDGKSLRVRADGTVALL